MENKADNSGTIAAKTDKSARKVVLKYHLGFC